MKKFRIMQCAAALGCAAGLSGCFFGLFGDEKGAAQSQVDATMVSASDQRTAAQGASGPVASDVAPRTGEENATLPLPRIPVDPETEVAVLTTPLGRIVIALNDDLAPRHSENFRRNIRTGLYEGTTFHRVIPGFIIQGGDPNSKDDDRSNDGLGGTGYTVVLEKKLRHERGAVAAARKPDKVNKMRRSNGAQFYICLSDAPSLDAKYSVFGRVVDGMDVVDRIGGVQRDAKDNPVDRLDIKAKLMKYREVGR